MLIFYIILLFPDDFDMLTINIRTSLDNVSFLIPVEP